MGVTTGALPSTNASLFIVSELREPFPIAFFVKSIRNMITRNNQETLHLSCTIITRNKFNIGIHSNSSVGGF